MPKHHGLKEQYGISAMCRRSHNEEGRFGRMFKDLPPFYMNPCHIDELTKVGGDMDAKNKKDKIKLPVGFVILGQFVDHDITLDITSRLDRNNDENATRNFRTPTLDLDCIYGQGPEGSPYLYRDGVRLHTGATSTAYTAYSPANLKKSDLSRTFDETAIIGDFRNDENRVLSQFQLAMINFHNCVADHLEKEKKERYKKMGCNIGDIEIEFEEVRKVVTWHYQWVVLNDFLPRIVGQDLVDHILCHGRKFYQPCNRPFIPIEFSAAAYRFGHSMIPLKLRVRKAGPVLDFFGSVLGIGFKALSSKDAIVDWDVLFGCNNYRRYEHADALDIKLASVLLDLPFIHPPGNSNLANRNLLRGQSFLLPSGEAVAELFESCGIDTHYTKVTAFTSKILAKAGHKGCAPLWFYILAEAHVLHNGEQMGPVGGRIVAETLIGLLELDELSFLGLNRQWKPTLPGAKPCEFTICDLLGFCK